MTLVKTSIFGQTTNKNDPLINICSTREAAETLDVSQRTIQLWVESGVLKAWKTPGGHRKISRDSISILIQKRRKSIEMQDFVSSEELNILYMQDKASPVDLIKSYFLWALDRITVQLVPNIFDGIISLSRIKPDLLIIDVEMTDVSGLSVIQYMKNNQEFNDIEIAIFTSMPTHKLINDVSFLPKIKVFSKPISVDYLEKYVESLISSKNK
jgi:excisionase family DNA binding protein